MEREKVTDILVSAASVKVINAARNKDEKAYRKAIAFLNESAPDKAKELSPKLDMQFYQVSGNWDKFKDAAKAYLKDGSEIKDWQLLNEVAWTFYEKVDCKKSCTQASQWAKRSIDLDKNYYNTDTYAALLYKTGNYNEATDAAVEAIALADKEKMHPKETMDLIMKMAFAKKYSEKAFDYVMKNKTMYVETFGEDMVAGKFGRAMQGSVKMADDKDKAKAKALATTKEYFPNHLKDIETGVELAYLAETKNWDSYKTKAKSSLGDASKIKDWYMLNNAAWNFYEFIDCQKSCTQALDWAKRSVELEENYYNTDTYAALLYKTKKYDEALKMITTALTLAKENNIRADESRLLKSKIEEALKAEKK